MLFTRLQSLENNVFLLYYVIYSFTVIRELCILVILCYLLVYSHWRIMYSCYIMLFTRLQSLENNVFLLYYVIYSFTVIRE